MSKLNAELKYVYDMYSQDPLDSVTIKHMNAYAQSRAPGPYRLIEGVTGLIEVCFECESTEHTRWLLEWM